MLYLQVIANHIICCDLGSVYHSSVLRGLISSNSNTPVILNSGEDNGFPLTDISVRVAEDIGMFIAEHN